MLKEAFDLALLASHIYLTREEREERRRQREREERRLAEREEREHMNASQQGNSFSYNVKMENCENCSVTISNTVEYHYYHE